MDTFTFAAILVTVALCMGGIVGYNFALKDFARWMQEWEDDKRGNRK